MPISSLTGLYIDQTYPRLVQTQGGEFADGLGTTLTLITSTGSLLTTASIVNNSNTIRFTKGNGSTFDITVNTGSAGGASFPFTGSAIITGSLVVTGSTTSTLGFTGSLFGTASWANNALTASYVTASRVVGTITSASYAVTASYVETAQTASYILASNVDGTIANATQATSASYADTASYTQNFIELTFPRINLTSDVIDPPGLPYTILTPGIYQITKAGDANPVVTSYSIIFPDPSSLDGTTITILNTDTTYNAAVDNPSSLIKNMDGNDVTSISNSSAAIFKSIDNKWWKLY